MEVDKPAVPAKAPTFTPLPTSHSTSAPVKGAKEGLAVTSKRLIVVVAVPNHVLKVQKGEWQKRVTRRIKS